MKLHRKLIATMALSIGLLAVGGVTYALSSVGFESRAQTWANANCSQELLNSKNNNPNNQTAALCSAYLTGKENKEQITNLPPHASDIFVFDANNNKLGKSGGFAPGSSAYFFHSGVDKFVKVNDQVGSGVAPGRLGQYVEGFYYSGEYCTGDKYILTFVNISQGVSIITQPTSIHEIYTGEPAGKHYRMETPGEATIHSHKNGGQPCNQDVDGNIFLGKLVEVDLGITDPIALPVHFAD